MAIITNRVVKVGSFAKTQSEFPEFHSTNVFLKSEVNE
jgi:hypothetical protein